MQIIPLNLDSVLLSLHNSKLAYYTNQSNLHNHHYQLFRALEICSQQGLKFIPFLEFYGIFVVIKLIAVVFKLGIFRVINLLRISSQNL